MALAGVTRGLKCLVNVCDVTVQKGRPCVPFRIQGIYTVTCENEGRKHMHDTQSWKQS
jgi:hypothetical protein